jgi:hypothetical protein
VTGIANRDMASRMVTLCANSGPMLLSRALEAFRRSGEFPSAHPSVDALFPKEGVRRLSKTRVNYVTNWPIAFLPAAQQRTGKDPLRSSPVERGGINVRRDNARSTALITVSRKAYRLRCH